MIARWAAVAVAALLLTGCAEQPAPEGLTKDQLAQWTAIKRDALWLNTGLPDELRPDAQLLQFVSYDDYPAYYGECMSELSYDGIGVQEATIADYRCSSYYVVSPEEQGYYSSAQLDATYDYYANWLVPCLAAEGFYVHDAPSRAGLASRPGMLLWNPYEEFTPSITPELFAKCKPYPDFLDIEYY